MVHHHGNTRTAWRNNDFCSGKDGDKLLGKRTRLWSETGVEESLTATGLATVKKHLMSQPFKQLLCRPRRRWSGLIDKAGNEEVYFHFFNYLTSQR